jgi:hypothetical protein
MRDIKYYISPPLITLLFCVLAVFAFLDACGTRPSAPVTPVHPAEPQAPAPATPPARQDEQTETPKSPPIAALSFRETWGYVLEGREEFLKPDMRLSDVVYFAGEVNSYGRIVDAPRRARIDRLRNPFVKRVHLSIVCQGAGLTHFVIEPNSRARRLLIDDIIHAARRFDGLNIDMELLPSRDEAAFVSFLAELKRRLPAGKVFSVCVPAEMQWRMRYNYADITRVADRVFVMAYDEHWGTSEPGPVASMDWCRRVAAYALETIGPKKLVMGLPLYGRAWADKRTARALINKTIQDLLQEHNIPAISREDGIPFFTYNENVKVKVYYDDARSIMERAAMYKEQGVHNIGFWRVGQEDTELWPFLSLE